jgi:hypothetical protein
MTYEPYMPWSCGRCEARGEVIVPASADCFDRVALVEEAHAIASETCPGRWDAWGLRVGQIVVPTAASPRRSVPWSPAP